MAGVGKLARLLTKGKDLFTGKKMQAIGKGLKSAGNYAIFPFKKAHTLQGGSTKYLKAETKFSDLSKAEKLYLAGTGGSLLGLLGTTATSAYAMGSGNEELDEKMTNTTAMGFIGLLAGGPIGAVLGGALGYFSTSTGNKEEAAVTEQPAVEPEPEPTPAPESEAAPADTVKTDTVPTPVIPPAVADSTATDSIPPATVSPVPRDSVAADSIPTQPKVPPVAPPDSAQVATTDSVPGQQATPPASAAQPTTTEEKLAAQEERIKELEERVAALEGKEASTVQEPPANNIFGGEINEISTKTLKVNIKGDCLWNIAKRELQKANPGKRITNAQILRQVKEFGRINPEIYGENPSLESLNNLQFGQELKLCA